VLHQLLIGCTLIGNQSAYQRTRSRSYHLLATRSPGAGSDRKPGKSAYYRTPGSVGFCLHLIDPLHHAILDTHRSAGTGTAGRFASCRHDAAGDYRRNYNVLFMSSASLPDLRL
jgi:hypothetical protein